MFISFLAALVGAALVEVASRLMARSGSSLPRPVIDSVVWVVSIAIGVVVGDQLASLLESKWQGALVVGLSVGLTVALGQIVIRSISAQQNAPTDRS